MGTPDFYADVTRRVSRCQVVGEEGGAGRSALVTALTAMYRIPGPEPAPWADHSVARPVVVRRYGDPARRRCRRVLCRLEAAAGRDRDSRLLRCLDEIHRSRRADSIDVGIVYGAQHMRAVVRHLAGRYGYWAADAAWMTVHAP